MNRDVVNLFPVEYLNGKWILAADIERGGVFAQAIGNGKPDAGNRSSARAGDRCQ